MKCPGSKLQPGKARLSDLARQYFPYGAQQRPLAKRADAWKERNRRSQTAAALSQPIVHVSSSLLCPSPHSHFLFPNPLLSFSPLSPSTSPQPCLCHSHFFLYKKPSPKPPQSSRLIGWCWMSGRTGTATQPATTPGLPL